MTDKERIAELEARIAELESAVRWVLGEGDSNFSVPANADRYWWRKELRARAFPPKFEEVEVKRYDCFCCNTSYSMDHDVRECCGVPTTIMSGTVQRPIPAKVKKREQLEVISEIIPSVVLKTGSTPTGVKYYREWEE